MKKQSIKFLATLVSVIAATNAIADTTCAVVNNVQVKGTPKTITVNYKVEQYNPITMKEIIPSYSASSIIPGGQLTQINTDCNLSLGGNCHVTITSITYDGYTYPNLGCGYIGWPTVISLSSNNYFYCQG